MQAVKKRVLLAEAGLLLAGLIWGTGFVVMKNALDLLPPAWLLCLRFGMASLILLAVFWKKLPATNRYTVIASLICGAFLLAGYYVQTLGLALTTAGNNAFITSFYVVLVPLLHWAFSRKKPGAHVFAAAVLCLAGVGVIALSGGLRVNMGDLLTLLCGVFYAFHIVAVSRASKYITDMYVFTGLQFLWCALFAGTIGVISEPFPSPAVLFSAKTLLPLFYLGLCCTLLALTLENVALKYAPPAGASLLMSTESPFGFLAGIVFLHEPFTLRFLMGAVLITGSIVLSELGDKLHLRKTVPAPAQTFVEEAIVSE